MHTTSITATGPNNETATDDLAPHPAALRRILAALSSIEPAHQPPSRRAS